jgi:hypothetical protein
MLSKDLELKTGKYSNAHIDGVALPTLASWHLINQYEKVVADQFGLSESSSTGKRNAGSAASVDLVESLVKMLQEAIDQGSVRRSYIYAHVHAIAHIDQ